MVTGFLSKNIFYPLFQIKEGNYNFLRYLKKIEKYYTLPKQNFEELRHDKLISLCRHSYSSCPFYKELFEKNSIDVDRICFDDLHNLPTLSKKIINKNIDRIISSGMLPSLMKDSSGGTTTEPLVFYRDKKCWDMRNAYQLYFNKLLGIDIGTKYALIWGASRDLYKKYGLKQKIKDNLIFRKIQLNATCMSKDNIDHFIDQFIRFKPKVIYGYPSAIDIFCHYILDRKLGLDFVKAVICTAEPLNEEQRHKINSILNCDAYDRYTSREVGIIAQECREHIGMHINALSVYLEIRNNKIILTDLDNYGMPLINYEIGDMSKDENLKDLACKCGFPSQVLQLGASRETDFFIKKDGTLVFGAGIPITSLTGEKGIKNIQIIQKDYELFVVKIVKCNEFNDGNLDRIKKTLKKYLGHDIKIRFQYLDNIERSKTSGKYRYVISEVKYSKTF